MAGFKNWKEKARLLRDDIYALSLALGDHRTPWYARVLMIVIVAYAVSPIDIIPDFIPVLGYLDDLILVPAGIYLVLKLIPAEVIAEYRGRVKVKKNHGRSGWAAAAVIILIWIGAAGWICRLVLK